MRAHAAKDLWLEELRIRSCSPATLDAYRRHVGEALKTISGYVGSSDPDLDDISRDSIVVSLGAYRSRPDGRSGIVRERSASSVARHLAAIKSWLAWCVSTEKVRRNVAATVPAPKIPQRVPKALGVDACRKIIEAANDGSWPARDRLVVLTGMALGLRLAEITGIELGSFAPTHVNPTHVKVLGKGAKERVVPVPQMLRGALRAYLTERCAHLEATGVHTNRLFVTARAYKRNGCDCLDMSRDGVAQVFEKALRAAALKAPGLRVHVARHSFATAGLSSQTFDLEELRTLLGHTSIATTQGYLRVDPERMAERAERHPLAQM